MKICHATDGLPGCHSRWGGAEIACQRIIKLLEKHGHESHVLTTRTNGDGAAWKNLRVVRTMEDWLGPKAGGLKSVLPIDPVARASATGILQTVRPDYLHLHKFNRLSFSIVSAAKRLGIQVVFSLYDYWYVCPRQTLFTPTNEVCSRLQGSHCSRCLEGKQGWRRVVRGAAQVTGAYRVAFATRKALCDRFGDSIDRFIVLTDTWVDVLSRYGIDRKKISVLPLPNFENLEAGGTETEKDTILFTSWVSPHKGLHVLIEALPAVLREIPAARLYVIATGETPSYRARIDSLLAEHHIREKVVFLGKLDNAEVKKVLQRVELVCVPEQWRVAPARLAQPKGTESRR